MSLSIIAMAILAGKQKRVSPVFLTPGRAGCRLPVRLSAPKRGQGQTIFREHTLGRPCCSVTKIEFFLGGCIAREQIALQRILKLLSDMLGTFLPC